MNVSARSPPIKPIARFAATSVFDLEHLSNSITSDLDGNPPLYITKRRKNNQDHIWINNAMVIRSRSNVQLTNQLGKKQVRQLFALQ